MEPVYYGNNLSQMQELQYTQQYGAQLEDEGDDGIAPESDTGAEQWVEFSSTLEPPIAGSSSGITALTFDPTYELLWSGYDSGRVTATFFPGSAASTPQQELVQQAYQQRDGWASKYCSFQSFHDTAVLEVLPLPSRVLSLSHDTVRLHSRGGLPLCSFKPLAMCQAGGAVKGAISCGASFQPSGGLMRAASEVYLLVGTSAPSPTAAPPCPVFDLQRPGVGALLSFDTGGVSTTCVQACSAATAFLSLGGQDGKIRLLDPSLRSAAVHHTLEAHSGPVRCLSVLEDGSALLSCGFTARALNPYDPRSPVTYHPDPLIRVFDMRMLRAASPLSLTIPGAPVAARFFPVGGRDGCGPGPAFVAATADGSMQTLALHPETLEQDMGALPEVLYASLLGVPAPAPPALDANGVLSSKRPQPDQVCRLAVAPSCRLVAAGSSLGTLSLNSLVENPASGQVLAQVNLDSVALLVPPLTPPRAGAPLPLPQAAPPPDGGPNPGSAYLLSRTTLTSLEASRLLSSYHSTPALRSRPLRLSARQKILPGTLALASFQGDHFLGSIRHADLVAQHHSFSTTSGSPQQQPLDSAGALFPPNSLLCAKAKGVGYAVCDPRVAMVVAGQRNAPRLPAQRVASPHLSPTVTLSLCSSPTDCGPLLPPPAAWNASTSYSEDWAGAAGTLATSGQKGGGGGRQHHPPTAYRKMKSHRGRHRMQVFNYRAYNATSFVGLENSTPNSWNNPVLQLLFAIPRVREAALRTQTSAYHHAHNPTSLLGELGFLFDMMLSIGASASAWNDVANVATAANFQRVFQCLPEANATGLFMLEQQQGAGDPSRSGAGGESEQDARRVQQNVQVFTRFLLQLVNKEAEQEARFRDEQAAPSPTSSPAKSRTRSVVEQTFGHALSVSTTFLVSNTSTSSSSGGRTDVSSCVLELVYPSPAAATSQPPPSFSAVLWQSCSQTSFQRGGWCAASDSYEPFRQTRSLDVSSIGDFLVLLCGDTLQRKDGGSGGWTPNSVWREKNSQGSAWLPLEVECFFVPAAASECEGAGDGGALFISELQSSESGCTWLIFDGAEASYSDRPASALHGGGGGEAAVTRLKLFGAVSGIMTDLGDGSPGHAHSVLHLRTKTQLTSAGSPPVTLPPCDLPQDEWTMFNDFAVMPCSAEDATKFKEWRFPCTLFYAREPVSAGVPVPGWPLVDDGTASSLQASLLLASSPVHKVTVPASVLSLASLSAKNAVPAPTMAQLRSTHLAAASATGDEGNEEEGGGLVLVAFDAEFVSVSVDHVQLDSRGERVVRDEARQVLARVSLLDGGAASPPSSPSSASSAGLLVEGARSKEDSEHHTHDDEGSDKDDGQAASSSHSTNKSNAVLLVDDYVLPSEAVVDYVTRFSGLVAEDLDPARSRHTVVSPRTAYLKLRYYLDAGCVFVGHGLQKDFETANIFVPPERVRDTVELWRLPHQRKISLRFLAYYLLRLEIQDDLHDSIEDSWTALLLYRHYLAVKAKGYKHFHGVLTELYAFGAQTNWTIGLDRWGNATTEASSSSLSPPDTDASADSHDVPPPALRHGRVAEDSEGGGDEEEDPRHRHQHQHVPIPLHPQHQHQQGGWAHEQGRGGGGRTAGIVLDAEGQGGFHLDHVQQQYHQQHRHPGYQQQHQASHPLQSNQQPHLAPLYSHNQQQQQYQQQHHQQQQHRTHNNYHY